MVDLIDSYSEANRTGDHPLRDNHESDHATYWSAVGQWFTTPASPQYKLTSCKFFMEKEGFPGLPTGNGHAVLYAESGGKPIGEALATSDAFDVSTLTTTRTLHEMTFSGGEQYTMSVSTKYCIVFEAPAVGTIDDNNIIDMGVDSAGSHNGEECYFVNGAWVNLSAADVCFYVYGTTAGGAAAPVGNIALLAQIAGIV